MRSCVLFLTSPTTSQEYISQVLSQFDANLSANIPCCVISSIAEPPIWCGTETPGPATAHKGIPWDTCLAGIKFDEEKMKAGSLDNVGITLHNVLDELAKYNVTHAVWITEQIPIAGASLILASGLMRFIKCHHGYLSIVSKNTDTAHSPWIRAMKAAVLLKSDVHKLAKIISKCCWVGDIQFKNYQSGSDVTLTGVLVQGKHTDPVTNGNLTTLHVIQMVSTVPLYILKECVDITTFRTDTARRLAILTSKGLLCRVTYQKELDIKLKSEWIRAVQTRALNVASNTVQAGYVLLWRGKLYTFRDVIHPPTDPKGGFINTSSYSTDWSYERRLLEYFEKAGSSECTARAFPVKVPAPKSTPAAAHVPHPSDILNIYHPEQYQNLNCDRTDFFDENQIASLPYKDAVNLQTHGIHYYRGDEEHEKLQELQRNYIHRETYCSLSLHNPVEGTSLFPLKAPSKRPLTKKFSDKTKVYLDRSQSLTDVHLCETDRRTSDKDHRYPRSKSSENLSRSSHEPTEQPTTSTGRPSRSHKNKILLKSVISECLAGEGIGPDHRKFKSLSNKLYDVCKLLLKDVISGNTGIRDTMISIVLPQTKMVVLIEKNKESKKC